jgi:hypothetical protein
LIFRSHGFEASANATAWIFAAMTSAVDVGEVRRLLFSNACDTLISPIVST